MNGKRGNTNMLATVAIGIVLFIVAIAVGYKITDVVKGTLTTDSLGYNQTELLEGDNGLGLLVDLAPLALIGLIVFGIVFAYMRFK